jgi:hypothetical protein
MWRGHWSMKESFDISLDGVASSLRVHGKPDLVGFMLYDLLKDAGYDDEEIQLIVAETHALAVESETML